MSERMMMSDNEKLTNMELAHLRLLQRIREAAGDPEGKLMQDELVERIRFQRLENEDYREYLGIPEK